MFIINAPMKSAFLPMGVSACIFIGVFHGAAAQEQAAKVGYIEEKERIVEASPPQKPWVRAEIGEPLVPREKVAARDASRAVLRLSNQHVLRVNENSQIVLLPSVIAGRPLGVEIQKGEIYLHSRGLPAQFGLVTPTVTGLPNGTQFRVRVEADGTTTFTMFEGEVLLENPHGKLRLGNFEQAIVEPGRAPRKTAVIEAKSTIQWCLYYPGVLHLPDLKIPAAEAKILHDSISAYESGDLLGALDRWPARHAAQSAAAKTYRAMTLLGTGQVGAAHRALSTVPKNTPGRRAIEEMIQAVNGINLDPVPDAAGPKNSRTASNGTSPAAGLAMLSLPHFVASMNLAGGTAEVDGKTASEWIAHSYYEQSRGRLESSLEAARRATALAPSSGYAAVRVAELEFAFGRTSAAARELERALKLTPRNAQAHALRGFLLSAQNRIREATEAFEHAIALDGALGNAWLGRGLCAIRKGRTSEGRRDLQVATVLEPNRALLHSYLGKAESQAGLKDEAAHDLDFAKQTDPRDPTPWLYSAVVNETQNRPNRAISDLQESISLNDNRHIYRSGMLLDQDRAVRGANLARIYQRAGFDDVAIREATRAVESDYTSSSAHLFLANSFDALRDPTRIQLRYETPWFNELLLANLLSPVGGGSLSQFVSQQEYSSLFEADGVHVSSLTEWRSDGIFRENASLYGTFGNFSFALDGSYYTQTGTRPNNRLGLGEMYATFKYQLSPDDTFLLLTKWANHQQGDLFQTYDNRPLEPNVHFKEKQEPGLILGGWNHRWAPGLNTLFLAGRLAASQKLTSPSTTQTLVQRDATGLSPGFLTQDPNLGSSFTDPKLAADPNAVTLGMDGQTLIYSPAFLAGISPYIGKGMPVALGRSMFDFYTLRQFELTTAELQQIWETKYNTALVGARWVQGDFMTDTLLNVVRPTFDGGFTSPAVQQHSETTMDRMSVYAYDYFRPAKWITLIGGVSWDRLEYPDNFRNPPVNDRERKTERTSHKAGFTVTPCRWITLRGVYAEGLGGVTFDESVRLEPVQIAGFNQSFRTIISESLAGSVEAPIYKNYGLSIEGRLPTRTWWSAAINILTEDVNRTVGVFDGYDPGFFPVSPAYFASSQNQRLAYHEETISASLQQLIGDEFSLSAGYRRTHARLRSTFQELIPLTPGADQQGQGLLHHVVLAANWNSPTGLFARAEANWYRQKVDGANFQGGTAGRRDSDFWQFNALIGYRFARNRCEVSVGVLNLMNTDYKLDAITYYDTLPRERTAVLRCKLTF